MNKPITLLLSVSLSAVFLALAGCEKKAEKTPVDTNDVSTPNVSTNKNTERAAIISAPKANPETATTTEPNRLYDEPQNYSIKKPETWTVEHPDDTTLLLRNPKSETGANLVVVVQNVGKDYDRKKYFDSSLESLISVVKSYEKVSEGIVGDFQSVTFTHAIEDKTIKQTIYFLVKEGKGYSLTATDYEENFDKNETTFEEIATSFKFIK